MIDRFVGEGRAGMLMGSALLLATVACGLGGGEPEEGEGEQAAVNQQTPAESPETQATASEPPASSGLCQNQYFPVQAGATWDYSSSDGSVSLAYTETVTEVWEDGFMIVTQFPEIVRDRLWSCTEQGLVALEYQGGGAAAISAEGASMIFETTEMNGVTVPAEAHPGTEWSQDFLLSGHMQLDSGTVGETTGAAIYVFKAVAEESVTVPAGTFAAIRVDVQLDLTNTITVSGVTVDSSLIGSGSLWYAEGVGLVKSVMESELMGEGFTETIELVSYSVP